MIKIFLVIGYDSYMNKERKRVFKTLSEANSYINGLTDSKIYMLSGKTMCEAVNKCF
jgi:hypothetical protein